MMTICAYSVALAVDKSSGARDEVKMLRDQLASSEHAVTLANVELDRLRRHTEQLNKNYRAALQKYDDGDAQKG